MWFYYLFFIFFIGTSAFAVEPSEILSDTRLENRARNLSSNIRCLVCQNENIDSSESEFAKDLRLSIRDQLVKGHTDDEIEKLFIQNKTYNQVIQVGHIERYNPAIKLDFIDKNEITENKNVPEANTNPDLDNTTKEKKE